MEHIPGLLFRNLSRPFRPFAYFLSVSYSSTTLPSIIPFQRPLITAAPATNSARDRVVRGSSLTFPPPPTTTMMEQPTDFGYKC